MKMGVRNIEFLKYKIKILMGHVYRCPDSIIPVAETFNEDNGLLLLKVPNQIWMFWDNKATMPEFVKICYLQVVKLNPTYSVTMLSLDNYRDYLPDTEFVDNLPIQLKSDLIRMNLLIKYGGIWLDATLLVLEGFDSIFNKIKYDKTTILFPHRPKLSDNPSTILIRENWFIASPPNNHFLVDILKRTMSYMKMDKVKYLALLSDDIKDLFGDVLYFKMMIAMYILWQEAPHKYSISSISFTNFGFNYSQVENSNFFDLRKGLHYQCFYKRPKVMPLVLKFTGSGFLLKQLQRNGCVYSKSIIGSVWSSYKSS